MVVLCGKQRPETAAYAADFFYRANGGRGLASAGASRPIPEELKRVFLEFFIKGKLC